MSERSRLRRRRAFAVTALVLAAVLPRVPWLDRAGPFMWDDGIHLLEARWLETGAEALAGSAARWRAERESGEDLWRFEPERAAISEATAGIPLFFPRPAYVASIAALAEALHVGVERAALVLSCVAGLVTVALVGLIGTRLWDRRTGWLGAMALALAGQHVAYSRMALAEAVSVAVVCAALLPLLARAHGDHRLGAGGALAAGLGWGVACLFQDRLLPFTLLPLWLAWRVSGRADPHERPSPVVLALAVGLPVVLLQAAAELPYYAGMIALQHFLAPLPFPTHVERLLGHYAQGVGISGFRPENLPTYPLLWGLLLGPALLAAIVAGAVRAASRSHRGGPAGDLLLWMVLPILPASFTAAGARYAAVSLPAAALLAGWALDPKRWPAWLARRVPEPRRGLALAGVALATLPFAFAPLRWSSGHAEAAAVLDEWGVECVVSTQPFVTAVDLGVERVEEPPRAGHPLEERDRRCDAHLVDALEVVLRQRDETTAAWLGELDRRSPDRVIANPAASSLLFPFEYNFSLTRTLSYLRSPERARAGEIRLYRDLP